MLGGLRDNPLISIANRIYTYRLCSRTIWHNLAVRLRAPEHTSQNMTIIYVVYYPECEQARSYAMPYVRPAPDTLIRVNLCHHTSHIAPLFYIMLRPETVVRRCCAAHHVCRILIRNNFDFCFILIFFTLLNNNQEFMRKLIFRCEARRQKKNRASFA